MDDWGDGLRQTANQPSVRPFVVQETQLIRSRGNIIPANAVPSVLCTVMGTMQASDLPPAVRGAGGEGKPHCFLKEVGFGVAGVGVWGVFVRFVLDNNVMGLAETRAMSPPDPLRIQPETQYPLQRHFSCWFALARYSPQR